jgi:potassium/chloride transporter 4/5/6
VPQPDQPAQPVRLGTFIGVFTPTMLTILGVIMYMRLGWVVGNAGLGGALLIIALANGITLITSLSLSALATNMRVGVGGAYFLISRSLGLEAGGAIGIPLYLSQTLSLTLYSFGLAESLRIVWPEVPVQLVAAVIVIVVTVLADRSTELALKAQLPIMGLIALSVIVLVMGIDFGEPLRTPVDGEWVDADFWGVFAVFFPAVTGVLAGVSLSGDLKNPGRAIPRGVLAAVLVGFVVYMTLPILLAIAVDPETLRTDSLIWTKVAIFGPAVLGGLWGAILSSAIGSILGAPRTLQALSNDGLLPRFLARTNSETGEPVLALRLSGALALACVALGDLNAVAAVVTMFFLTTYGTLNAVAGLEALVGDLSYRPRIRIPSWVSGLGALGCFVAMMAINPLAGVVAISAVVGIWLLLSRRAMRAAWGDLRSGLWFTLARVSLYKLRDSRFDARNWRPHVLVFTRDVSANHELVQHACMLSQERGIITVSTLLEGDVEEHEHAEQLMRSNQQLLDSKGLNAFYEVAAVSEIENGMITVAQANGFAGLTSNTSMFGWSGDDDPEGLARTLGVVRRMSGMEKCSLVLRYNTPDPQSPRNELVCWWRGKQHNGDLMLLLAHLLTQADGWRRVRIVLRSIVPTEEAAEQLRESMKAFLTSIRIPAEMDVIVPEPGQSIAELIREGSRNARLVLLGLPEVPAGEERDTAERLLSLVEGLPPTLLVRNAGPFRGRLV